MTRTLTVPRSLEHIVETECSPRVVAMSSYLLLGHGFVSFVAKKKDMFNKNTIGSV